MKKNERNPNLEYPDPTPLEWPIGVSAPESMEQKIARMVRTSVSEYANSVGQETFDEADDFDIEDPEALPDSRHELDDDQERILRDQQAARAIPPNFRLAFEEDQRLRREAGEQLLKNTPVEKPTAASSKNPGEPVQ